jgi:hypothetical protein
MEGLCVPGVTRQLLLSWFRFPVLRFIYLITNKENSKRALMNPNNFNPNKAVDRSQRSNITHITDVS